MAGSLIVYALGVNVPNTTNAVRVFALGVNVPNTTSVLRAYALGVNVPNSDPVASAASPVTGLDLAGDHLRVHQGLQGHSDGAGGGLQGHMLRRPR